MLKFQWKKERLDFGKGWVTEEKEMTDDHPDSDILSKLAKGNSSPQDLDNVMNYINQSDDET